MKLFDGIISRMGYTKAGAGRIPAWMESLAAANKFNVPDGTSVEFQERLYQKLSWIQMAISILARSAATGSFSVFRMDGESMVDIPNHEFESLIRKPNPMDSRFELMEATFSNLALTGNAYWWMNRMGENSQPVEIWPLPTHCMTPVPDEKMYLKGYKFDAGLGRSMVLEPWEVVHFRRFNPKNPYVGLSPIEAINMISVGDLKMSEWNTRMYGDNNGRLPGILAFADPIIDSDWEQMKADTKQAAKERAIMMLRNAGKGGVEWIPISISQKDMEYIAVRTATKEEIFGIFAPGLASMLATSATEANASAGKSTFDEFSRWPLMQSVGEKITMSVLPSYGDDLVGEFDEIRKKDQEMNLRNEEAYARTHTVDEVRKKYYGDQPVGDDRGKLFPAEVIKNGAPVPGVTAEAVHGTERLVPSTPSAGSGEDESDPADQASDGKESPLPPFTKGGNPSVSEELGRWKRKVFKAIKAGKSADVEFETDIIPDWMYVQIRENIKGCKTVEEIGEVFMQPKYVVQGNTLEDIGLKAKKPPKDAFPSRREFEALMEKRVSGEWKGQLKKLMELIGDPPLIENVPQDFWDESNRGLRRVFEQTLEEIFMEKAHLFLEVAPIGGVDWTQVNEGATDWARAYSFEKVKEIDDVTRKGIAKEVERYYRDGLTVDEIGRNLEKYYNAQRAHTIAVTETTRAANQADKGVVDEIATFGIEMYPIGETSEDDKVCDVCNEKNEKELDPNNLAPWHPECRCGQRWVIRKSAPSTSSGTGGKNG